MNNKIYSLFAAAAVSLALASCDDWTPADQATSGQAEVSAASFDLKVDEAPSAKARSGIDVSGYMVTVTDKATGAVATSKGQPCSWAYGSMPQVFSLPVGQYTVNVMSHTPQGAAWDAPYYEGSSDFSVENNRVNYIGTVTCRFRSLKVDVAYTPEMAAVLGNDATVTVAAGAAGYSLTWGAGETRTGYFSITDGNPTVIATFSGTVRDQHYTVVKDITDARPGDYYIITFGISSGNPLVPDEYGSIEGVGTGVTINYEVINSGIDHTVTPGEDLAQNPGQHPDTEEWPDTPDIPDLPGDVLISFTSATLQLGESGVNDPSTTPAIVVIKADNGIANLRVKIVSDNANFLASVGELMPTEFDLALVDGDLAANLSSIGLPVGAEVKGQTSVDFNISDLAPLLGAFPGNHEFRIDVTDAKGDSKGTILKYVSK